MLAAIMTMTILGLGLGLLLGLAARYLKIEGNPMAEEIEAMLPGAQCGQCGYPGCAAAARALAAGEAPVTLCPPGGKTLAERLALKLHITVDLSRFEDAEPHAAHIQEEFCIGCTRCIRVCPTDAVVGAAKQIHVVISEACTGCGNCVDVCPTGGIALHPVPVTLRTWRWHHPDRTAA